MLLATLAWPIATIIIITIIAVTCLYTVLAFTNNNKLRTTLKDIQDNHTNLVDRISKLETYRTFNKQ